MKDMFFGIDLGSSSVKAIAVSEEKTVHAQAVYPEGTSPYEHDSEMVLGAVKEACQSIFSQGVSPDQIIGIGLCGHGPSIIFFDSDGKALTPIVTWQDSRSGEETRELAGCLPGYAKAASAYEAKLLWFYRRFPELFSKGIKALYPKDYIIYKLSGRVLMDHSTASAIAYYDVANDNWDRCEAFFPKDVMPEVVPAYEEACKAETSFAKECGFLPSTPIYPGGIDCFCESVGAGGFREDILVDGSGTSTVVARSIPLTEGLSRHVLPGASYISRSLSCSGLSYQWLGSVSPDTDLNALQEKLDPSVPSGLLYLPYINGERFPVFDEKASGVFAGLRVSTTTEDMLKALFEGVAFAVRQCVDFLGEGATRVRAVGGANRSEKWLQIKANVTGLPYEQMQERDASALGAALMAALGSGLYSAEDLIRLAKVKRVFEPQPGTKALYDAYYEQYKALYPALKDIMHHLCPIRQ